MILSSSFGNSDVGFALRSLDRFFMDLMKVDLASFWTFSVMIAVFDFKKDFFPLLKVFDLRVPDFATLELIRLDFFLIWLFDFRVARSMINGICCSFLQMAYWYSMHAWFLDSSFWTTSKYLVNFLSTSCEKNCIVFIGLKWIFELQIDIDPLELPISTNPVFWLQITSETCENFWGVR